MWSRSIGHNFAVRHYYNNQLMWNIFTTWTYGLYDLSEPVNKIGDSSHRVFTLHILTVSPDHDADSVHRN